MRVEVNGVEWRITTIGEFTTTVKTRLEDTIEIMVYKAEPEDSAHWNACIRNRTIALESFDIESAMIEAYEFAKGYHP